MSIFSKILPLFFLPVGLGMLLMTAGLVSHRKVIAWFGVLLLWLCSMPVVADNLMRSVEGKQGGVAVASVGSADAVVVLSGMICQVEGSPLGEWGDAADRFEAGVGLYRAGKAPRIIFTGGQWPWQPDMVPEGQLLAKRAYGAGVPAWAVSVTPAVGNTLEEARAVGQMLRSGAGAARPRVILVTSAFHMQRSSMLFERAGILVERFPVDYRTESKERVTLLSFLPQAEALEKSSVALHELMGRLYLGTY